MNKKFLEKAKASRSVEELLALARENEMEMTEAEAKSCFAQLNPENGVLGDAQLEHIVGGIGVKSGAYYILGNKSIPPVNRDNTRPGYDDDPNKGEWDYYNR